MSKKLQDFFGMFWPMVKPYVSGVKIEFDAVEKCVYIKKGETFHVLRFDDIEKAINNNE